MPDDLNQLITGLADTDAVRILQTFAAPWQRRGAVKTELTPDLRQALAAEFADAAPATGATEGDLARAALLLAAEDDANREPLRALITGPAPESLGFAASITVITAAIIALQTHVKFERDKDGRLHVKIEKKPLNDALLNDVINKLFGYSPGPD
jgi:hypothetical protein